jgi:hypothetical protein
MALGVAIDFYRLTTVFTCRAGCKERDVTENHNPGPVVRNGSFDNFI